MNVKTTEASKIGFQKQIEKSLEFCISFRSVFPYIIFHSANMILCINDTHFYCCHYASELSVSKEETAFSRRLLSSVLIIIIGFFYYSFM